MKDWLKKFFGTKKNRIISISVILILFLAILCLIFFFLFFKSEKDQDPTQSLGETETQLVEAETEIVTESVDPHIGQAVSALTGEWIEKEQARLRPVAIMTENTSVCQPQFGISKADVYYECPVEGGITRMLSIFQDYSGMKKIGNVRSCRTYYVYFAKEFDAIYMHAGQSHFAKDLVESSYIDNVNGITGKGGPYYYRDSGRKAPHNLYTSSKSIKEAIKNLGYRKKHTKDYKGHYQFADEDQPEMLENGEDAKKISFYYSCNSPWFEYNEKDGLYYRFQFGQPHIDGNNNEQIAVKNILIQDCSWYLWEASTGYLYLDYMKGGKGKYITNGKCIDITWERETEDGPTRYYDLDHNEIKLNVGKTFVEVCQDDYSSRNVISATVK